MGAFRGPEESSPPHFGTATAHIPRGRLKRREISSDFKHTCGHLEISKHMQARQFAHMSIVLLLSVAQTTISSRCPRMEESLLFRDETRESAQSAAMSKLYKSIQDSVHVAGAHSFLVTASPGFAVDPTEFENAFSPSNPTGSLAATEIFSTTLCDPSPYLQAVF